MILSFSDRHMWANSEDPDQTAPGVEKKIWILGVRIFRIFTVYGPEFSSDSLAFLGLGTTGQEQTGDLGFFLSQKLYQYEMIVIT